MAIGVLGSVNQSYGNLSLVRFVLISGYLFIERLISCVNCTTTAGVKSVEFDQ
jgi:hypothetical protein